jgi:hypothetical protein
MLCLRQARNSFLPGVGSCFEPVTALLIALVQLTGLGPTGVSLLDSAAWIIMQELVAGCRCSTSASRTPEAAPSLKVYSA